MRFRDLAKVNFPLGKTAFQKVEKMCCENIINTGVYEDFWTHFREIITKPPPKALRFSVKADNIPQHRPS